MRCRVLLFSRKHVVIIGASLGTNALCLFHISNFLFRILHPTPLLLEFPLFSSEFCIQLQYELINTDFGLRFFWFGLSDWRLDSLFAAEAGVSRFWDVVVPEDLCDWSRCIGIGSLFSTGKDEDESDTGTYRIGVASPIWCRRRHPESDFGEVDTVLSNRMKKEGIHAYSGVPFASPELPSYLSAFCPNHGNAFFNSYNASASCRSNNSSKSRRRSASSFITAVRC
jgi:hypothetical protein